MYNFFLLFSEYIFNNFRHILFRKSTKTIKFKFYILIYITNMFLLKYQNLDTFDMNYYEIMNLTKIYKKIFFSL